MSLGPKSPRVGRSPKLKAKWLANTLAYQYGNATSSKSEIIILSSNLDQYLQDIFQSMDSRGRGKIPRQDFTLLCDLLHLKDHKITDGVDEYLTFSEFHERLCEHFACYGDFAGFLVNQNFRTINVNRQNGKPSKASARKYVKPTEFQHKIANSKNHKCIHDADMFKNWDKLRLSGLRLSEMREHIDQLLYEVTFHKEEGQSLKEILEDLRCMLQASDAQNLGMQVALKKCQQRLETDAGLDFIYSKSNNRLSLPIEGTKMSYKPLIGEEKSVAILAGQLTQLRELREKEVNELITFNSQLQHDITDLSREVVRLEDENRKLNGQMAAIVNTYNCCRQLFQVCVESFREVESAGGGVILTPTSIPPTPTSTREEKFTFKNISGDTTKEEESDQHDATMDSQPDIQSTAMDAVLNDGESMSPELQLIGRLEAELSSLQGKCELKQQELSRLEPELTMCRRHLQNANFQIEALETECSRLLAMEDQLVSVFSLLQKGRTQCLSRKTLGQLLLDVIDSNFGEEEQDMTADQFIRGLQQTLTDCPLLMFST